MRLSEAIRLGGLTFGELEAGGGGRCALNCGLAAIGHDDIWQHSDHPWPWLSQWCDVASGRYEAAPFKMKIAWLFDYEVMQGKMTLEALCDQVRAWEDELESRGINVEQVSLAAELTELASPTQSIQEVPLTLTAAGK